MSTKEELLLTELLETRNDILEIAFIWREIKIHPKYTDLHYYFYITKNREDIYINISKKELDYVNIDKIIEWLRNNFPNKRFNISKDKLFKMFENLKQYKPIFLDKEFDLPSINRKGSENLFEGKSKLLLNKPEYYEEFNLLPEYFMDLERMKVKRQDTDISPLDAYRSDTKRIVEECVKKYGKIDYYTLRETIYHLTKEATEFKPNIMVALIKLFNAKKVGDPSAGRGSRLIGCISQNVEYVGVDPDFDLRKGYEEIINLFVTKEEKHKYKVIEGKAQDKSLDIGNNFDLVFTSPPYRGFEEYSKDKSQSMEEFPLLKDWIDGFILGMVDNWIPRIKKGGYFAININDPGCNFKGKEAFTVKVVKAISSDKRLSYKGVIGYAEGTQNKLRLAQPIWIWKID